MMEELIKKIFESTIQEAFGSKYEIKNYLLNHERRPLFIANMLKHLDPIDKNLRRVRLTRANIESIVKDMTLFFCKIAIDQVEKIEIEKIKVAAEYAKEMENFKVELDERCNFEKKVF